MRALVLLISLLYSTLQAQNEQNIFSLKPSLGLNVCQVHGDNFNGYRKPGIFGGLGVNARINNRLSFEFGLYFSQKGANHNPTKDNPDSYYRLNLNYIDLPLSLRYMLNTRYFITLGPSIAYLASYKENIDYTDYTGVYKFNSYEAGLNIGLGRTVVNDLSVEVRCSNSITAIRDYGQVSHVFYPNPVARFFNKGFYNNILTLMLTYKLDFSNKRENSET